MQIEHLLRDSNYMATNLLSRSEVAAYHREGFVCPVPAIEPEQAQNTIERLLRFEAETGLSAGATMGHKGHLKLTALYALVFHEKIVDAAESILGPNILCWGSSLLVKEAGSPNFVAWHQDSAYWGVNPEDVCTVGLALTPSTSENGAMRVIPCSHQSEQMALPHRPSGEGTPNSLFSGEEIAVEIDEAQAVELLLAQGEMSLHHIKVVHGSPPNRSDGTSVLFSIRYVAPHVRPPEGFRRATLVRGHGLYGYFEPDPVPTRDMEPEIVAFVDSPDGRPRTANGKG